MWIVVYVTRSETAAGKLMEKLEKNGIISRLRHTEGEDCFEVLVPQAELAKAQELIFELD